MSRTIVFYGGDTQVGTTMTALAAAESLAKSGQRVLFLNLSGVPGDAYLPFGAPVSVDDLRAGLLDESLSEAEFRQTLISCRGVDVLPGVRNWQSSRVFPKTSVEAILTIADKEWDYVIADGGCGVSEGLGIQAVRCFDLRIVVVTQQEKTLDRYRRQSEILKEIISDNRMFLINKFNDNGAFYTVKQMAERLDCSMEQVLTVPYVPYGWQAEAEHVTLMNFHRFRKGILRLAEYILKREKTESGDTVNAGI